MIFKRQLFLILFCAAAPLMMQAYEYGPDQRVTGAPGDTTCIQSGCHVGTVNSSSGSVKIVLPGGSTTYVPGQPMTIQVLITDPAKGSFGFEMTARLASNLSKDQAGDFVTGSDGFTQVLCDNGSYHDDGLGNRTPCPVGLTVQFIEHTLNGYKASISTKRSYTYQFTWTPPAAGAGNVTLYVAANAGQGIPNSPQVTGTNVYTSKVTLTPATQSGTTTTLSSSANPSPFGQNITLTAAVTPSNVSGTVQFLDGTTSLGTATLSGGTATLSVSCLAAATHSITAVYSGDSNNASSTSAVLTQVVNQPTDAPVITSGGVVPIFSTSSTIQPGSWVSIYGCNLASEVAIWSGDFPTSLGKSPVTVKIDNKPAYIWFVSPGQINVQVPDDTVTGPVPVTVTTSLGTSNAVTATLAPYAPAFILFDATHAVGVILTSDGSGFYDANGNPAAAGKGVYDLLGPKGAFGFNTRPAKKGETVELFGVGFGPTQTPAPAGQALKTPSFTTSPVTATIGGVDAPVAGAVLIFAGEYQINVTIPTNIGTGDQTLIATVGGVQPSQTVAIPVQ